MARVTLIIGLANQTEVDCPVESREEAQRAIESFKGADLVKLPRPSYTKVQGSETIGVKGVVFLQPTNITYCQILGADD